MFKCAKNDGVFGNRSSTILYSVNLTSKEEKRKRLYDNAPISHANQHRFQTVDARSFNNHCDGSSDLALYDFSFFPGIHFTSDEKVENQWSLGSETSYIFQWRYEETCDSLRRNLYLYVATILKNKDVNL